MADHPDSVFCGLNSVLKSLVASFNSSGDITMYRFGRFVLKLPIHARFGVTFGANSPHMTSPIVLSPYSTVLGRKHDV